MREEWNLKKEDVTKDQKEGGVIDEGRMESQKEDITKDLS